MGGFFPSWDRDLEFWNSGPSYLITNHWIFGMTSKTNHPWHQNSGMICWDHPWHQFVIIRLFTSLQGFIYPRWCRISSIKSISYKPWNFWMMISRLRFFLRPLTSRTNSDAHHLKSLIFQSIKWATKENTCPLLFHSNGCFQEISNRTHVSRTPKPEYLIARSQLTERGPLGSGPIQFLMDC